MSGEVTAAVIGGVAGVLTGGIGSLAAPWAQWGVEKRRLKHARRLGLIESWESGIRVQAAGGPLDGPTNGAGEPEFRFTQWYLTLRPHLTPGALRELEPGADFPAAVTVHVLTPHHFDSILRDEVERIKRVWGVA